MIILIIYLIIGFLLPIVIYYFNKDEANAQGIDDVDIFALASISMFAWFPVLIYTIFNPNWVE